MSKKIYLDRFQRVFGKLALITLVAYTLERTYGTFDNYFRYPTYFETRYVSQFYAQTPAFTMCSLRGYKSDVLMKNGITRYRSQTNKANISWTSNTTETTEQKLFDDATHRFDELVASLKIRTMKENDKGMYHYFLNITNDLPSVIKEQRHRAFGKCYTFIAEKAMKELGIYYIQVTFHRSAKVYYHANDDFLAFNGRMGHKVLIGKKIQAQIKVQDTLMVPRIIEKTRRKKQNENYFSCAYVNFDECMYDILTKIMKKVTRTNCTVPWIPNNDNICKEQSDVNLAFQSHVSRSTNQKDDCPSKCHVLTASVLGKNTEENKSKKQASLFSYFSMDVEKRSERYLYDAYRLMAEVGGYLGLFLGYSLLNVSDYIQELIKKRI